MRSTPRCRAKAYPRSRGATVTRMSFPCCSQGLSPLARGNPATRWRNRLAQGPIPARAGQPLRRLPVALPPAAYPRSRGATCDLPLVPWGQGGLSPLARGNPHRTMIVPDAIGPIPARAGQPPAAPCATAHAGAYPRSRGATVVVVRGDLLQVGLSPLARGNPEVRRRAHAASGPIPARAGQPPPWQWSCTRCRAYPRSRGATSAVAMVVYAVPGLSPLARGNPAQRLASAAVHGPIPARAGQPQGRRQG